MSHYPRNKTLWIIAGLMGLLLSSSITSAQALSRAEWDRNADADQVDHYELYVCATVACSPLVGATRLGDDVRQPLVVVQPIGTIQRVGMPWPITAPLLGRVSVVAVDVFGSKSLESNVVVFRSQPLNAPKGLLVK